ncbi:MAG: hypothetical protein KC656_03145, partial [Myxococcales bacterium]|nr:hypothetical protein [Myxococcales bacterium]
LTALLVLAVACNPTQPVPTEPPSWTISPQSHCDGSFDYHAVAWDDELPDGLGTPREIVASRSDRLVSLAPWPGWEVPWFRDALTWHIELAPHPRRPAVRLSSSAPEICPPMWVFPVVGVARSERFLIVDSGGRDLDAWGEVYRSTELPWLEGSVSAVRVYQDGSMETDVDLNPAEDLLFSTWPDGLAEDMALFAPGDEGLDVPVVRFSENAETAELSPYHVRYFPRGAIYSGGAGGGVADARAALPWTTCAQPDPAVDEADRQALAAWTSADRTLLLDIDWLVPAPFDTSRATLRIEQVGEPVRVAVPVEGVCTTTVLAALDGTVHRRLERGGDHGRPRAPRRCCRRRATPRERDLRR